MRRLAIAAVVLLLSGMQAPIAAQQKTAYKWPGFVPLNDSVWMSEREISVRDYAELLLYMDIFFGSYSQLQAAMPYPSEPDWKIHNVYRNTLEGIGPFYELVQPSIRYTRLNGDEAPVDTAVSYPAYIQNLPVVNITKTQALLYCEMRTRAFDTLKKYTAGRKGWQLPQAVYFRLPTLEEWQKADSVAAHLPSKKEKKEGLMGQIISRDLFDSLQLPDRIPRSVFSGYRTDNGIYNLRGNVAELLMDKEEAVGGSYLHRTEDCRSDHSCGKAPASHIGFRIVAQLKRPEEKSPEEPL